MSEQQLPTPLPAPDVKPTYKLSDYEKEYIRTQSAFQSDKAIGQALNRDFRTIREYRKKAGIHKVSGGKLVKYTRNENLKNKPSKEKKAKLEADSAEKLANRQESAEIFFREQFKNTLYYTNLKQQFTDEEIEYYLEEWGSLCVQFEDIVATEKRQIDELIKAEIIGMRILRNIKVTDEIIREVEERSNLLRQKTDFEDNEAWQDLDKELSFMITRMAAQSNGMTSDYEKNVKIRNDILAELNARRSDRIDQLKRTGTTFAGLVQAFRDRAIRDAQGKQLELIRMAKEKKSNDWRKVNKFPDGSKDSFLFDASSEVSERTRDFINSPPSALIEKFRNLHGKKILVLDSDPQKIQFFSNLLRDHIVVVAKNFGEVQKFCQENYFDLFCLSYDIGENINGDVVAEMIVNKNFSPKAEVLIHSTAEEGAQKIYDIMKDTRNVERYSYDLLTQAYFQELPKEGESNG